MTDFVPVLAEVYYLCECLSQLPVRWSDKVYTNIHCPARSIHFQLDMCFVLCMQYNAVSIVSLTSCTFPSTLLPLMVLKILYVVEINYNTCSFCTAFVIVHISPTNTSTRVIQSFRLYLTSDFTTISPKHMYFSPLKALNLFKLLEGIDVFYDPQP